MRVVGVEGHWPTSAASIWGAAVLVDGDRLINAVSGYTTSRKLENERGNEAIHFFERPLPSLTLEPKPLQYVIALRDTVPRSDHLYRVLEPIASQRVSLAGVRVFVFKNLMTLESGLTALAKKIAQILQSRDLQDDERRLLLQVGLSARPRDGALLAARAVLEGQTEDKLQRTRQRIATAPTEITAFEDGLSTYGRQQQGRERRSIWRQTAEPVDYLNFSDQAYFTAHLLHLPAAPSATAKPRKKKPRGYAPERPARAHATAKKARLAKKKGQAKKKVAAKKKSTANKKATVKKKRRANKPER